jgi:hypothetical protein
VAVGGTVDYEIVATVDATSDGLAGFAVDLVTDTGVAQPQASPGSPQMTVFVRDNGLTDPSGFGGTVDADGLVQIGGGQNTMLNPGPNPPCPTGDVETGIGVGGEVVLATGSIQLPDQPGSYQVSLANQAASVITGTGGGGSFHTVDWADAVLGTESGFAVEVAEEGLVHNVTLDEYYFTIQEAIDAAADGNQITVPPCRHVENIDFGGKNITVQGSDAYEPEVVAAARR